MHSMLYRVLKAQIEKGRTTGMTDKLDVFWSSDKISKTEYMELKEMLENAST